MFNQYIYIKQTYTFSALTLPPMVHM